MHLAAGGLQQPALLLGSAGCSNSGMDFAGAQLGQDCSPAGGAI